MSTLEKVLLKNIEADTLKKTAVLRPETEYSEIEDPTAAIRCVDDVVINLSDRDGLLLRRLKASKESKKFLNCVASIKNAMRRGAESKKLIINIVAKGYNSDKDVKALVEILLNSALMDDSNLPIMSDKSARFEDNTRRYYAAQENIVDDIDISKFYTELTSQNVDERSMRAAIASRINSSFFGTQTFDPSDPRNALYPIIDYWSTGTGDMAQPDPDAPETNDDGSPAEVPIGEFTSAGKAVTERAKKRGLQLGTHEPDGEVAAGRAGHHNYVKNEGVTPQESAVGYGPGARHNVQYARPAWAAKSVEDVEKRHEEYLAAKRSNDPTVHPVVVGGFPGFMPNERHSMTSAMRAYDPSNLGALSVPFNSSRTTNDFSESGNPVSIKTLEQRAEERYRYLIDHGVKNSGANDSENPDFARKYILYATLLSEIQGLRKRVALFHEGGFSDTVDNEGKKVFGTQYVPGPAADPDEDSFDLPQIAHDDIVDFINGFMDYLGLKSEEVENQAEQEAASSQESSEAASEESSGLDSELEGLDVNQLRKRDQQQKKEIVDKIQKYEKQYNVSDKQARKIVLAVYVYKHFSKAGVEMDFLNEEEISNYFMKEGYGLRAYAPFAEEAKTSVQLDFNTTDLQRYSDELDLMQQQASGSSAIKTSALHPAVKSHNWFNFIMKQIQERGNPNVSEHVTSEYVLNALLFYIEKQINQDDILTESDLPKNGSRIFKQFSTIESGGSTQIKRNKPSWPVFIIKFSAEEQQKFGIRIRDGKGNVVNSDTSEADFNELIHAGNVVYLLIHDENGQYTPIQTSIHDAYIVHDPKGSKKSYSQNGPYLKLFLNGAPSLLNIEKDIPANGYSLYLPQRPIKSIKGLKKDLYGYLYGKENGNRMLEIHKENGIDVSMSPYPWWAPSLYDFRERVESEFDSAAIGHPNNAYNLRKKLEELVFLRQSLIRKSSMSVNAANENVGPITVLDKAIHELRMILFHWHRFNAPSSVVKPDTVENENKAGIKERSRSLMRDFMDESSKMEQVRIACQKAGIPLGHANTYFNMESSSLPNILSDEDYSKYVQIRDEFNRIYKNKKNVMIFRGADAGLNEQLGNGLFHMKPRASSQEIPGHVSNRPQASHEMVWSEQFAQAITSLRNQLGQAENASHVIFISDEPIPAVSAEKSDESLIAYVTVPVEIIDSDELQEITNYFVKETKREILSKLQAEAEELEQFEDSKEKDDQIAKIQRNIEMVNNFVVPFSYIKALQRNLSNANFQRVKDYVQKQIGELVSDYNDVVKDGASSADAMRALTNIIENKKANLVADALGIKRTDSVLERLNIAVDMPKFSLDEYVVQRGSGWEQYLTKNLLPVVSSIKESKKQADLFQRLIDAKLGLGEAVFSEKKGVVEVTFKISNSPSSIVYWFPLEPSSLDVTDFEVDVPSSDFAIIAGFSVSGTVYSKAKSSKNKKYVYNKSNLEKCRRDMERLLKTSEIEIRKQKTMFPVIITLEGSPGTGKSIFAEVLASSLECSYLHTTLTEIMNSGTPQLRGGSEQNMHLFLSMCRSRENSVLLVDEIDNYLLVGANESGSADVRKALGELKKCWDESGDYPKYRANNFHIVCTTNNVEALRAGAETKAMFTRMPAEKVMLPSDPNTLRDMFAGRSIVNNLINFMCAEDVALCQMAKQLLDLYKDSNPDENNRNTRALLIRRIQEKKPDFFVSGCLIRLNKAKQSVATQLGLDADTAMGADGVASELKRKAKYLSVSDAAEHLREALNTIADDVENLGQQRISKEEALAVIEKSSIDDSSKDAMRAYIETIFDVDQVKEFVEGWKYVEDLFSKMNTSVTVKGKKGQDVSFNPLEAVCQHLSSTMVIPGPVTHKKYARTSLRQLMVEIVTRFQSHQRYLSGDSSAMPLNYKTFVASFFATTYKPALNANLVDARDWADETWRRTIAGEESIDGFTGLVAYSGLASPYKGAPPREAFETEEDYYSRIGAISDMIKASKFVNNEDGGLERIKESVVTKFALNDNSFDSTASQLMSELNAKNNDSTKVFSFLLGHVIKERSKLKSYIETEKDQKKLLADIKNCLFQVHAVFSANRSAIFHNKKSVFELSFQKYEKFWNRVEAMGMTSTVLLDISFIASIASDPASLKENWTRTQQRAQIAHAKYVEKKRSGNEQVSAEVDAYQIVSGQIGSKDLQSIVDQPPKSQVSEPDVEELNEMRMRYGLEPLPVPGGGTVSPAPVPTSPTPGAPPVAQPTVSAPVPPVNQVSPTPPPVDEGQTPPVKPDANKPPVPLKKPTLGQPVKPGVKPASLVGEVKTSTDYFYNHALEFFNKQQIKTAQAPEAQAKPIPAATGTPPDVVPQSASSPEQFDGEGIGVHDMAESARVFAAACKRFDEQNVHVIQDPFPSDYHQRVMCPAKAPGASAAPIAKPPVVK